MCAAAELGVTKIPALDTGGARGAAGWDGGDLIISPRTEDALYWVTSNSTMSTYSMPDRVVHAARLLDLRVAIHKLPGVYTSLLERLYGDVIARCRGMNVAIETTAPPPLETNQRELVVVSTFVIGLHYVLRRPNNSYMDPADGRDHESFNALNTWDKCYQPTGLSLVVTGNEVSGEEMRRLFEDHNA